MRTSPVSSFQPVGSDRAMSAGVKFMNRFWVQIFNDYHANNSHVGRDEKEKRPIS